MNVSVTLARSAAEPEGVTSIEVDCPEFDSHRRMMPDPDAVATLNTPFADPDAESLRQKLNEFLLAARR